jgi:TPP-dependent indolepyruvate ferredoxin oxidoreductase alpha subunit
LQEGIDHGDVGVVEPGQDQGFVAEPLHKRSLADQMWVQHLDGHRAFELGVGGPIDGSHASLAQQRFDAIVVNESAFHFSRKS